MAESENRLRLALEERRSQDSLRRLNVSSGKVDFCSNDYLGFSRSETLKDLIEKEVRGHGGEMSGSTGSRLISGNSVYFEEIEKFIAEFHHGESGLIFNSGYDANLGLLSSVPQRSDVVLYDQLVHASIRDGIRLSHARAFSFAHNDVDDLERRLKQQNSAAGHPPGIFVAVESVYSMDGDCAPLTQMVDLCRRYNADLIVDEAHATGVFGSRGEGKCAEMGIEKNVFARVHTFGKALGTHGAIVIGSETLRSYLVNFARSFIYTTALPFHSLASVRCAYQLLASSDGPTRQLRENISFFKSRPDFQRMNSVIPSDSAIQCVIIPGNSNARSAAGEIQAAGFDVRPILHPTVPEGAERLRICLHSFNSQDEIEGLTDKITRMRK